MSLPQLHRGRSGTDAAGRLWLQEEIRWHRLAPGALGIAVEGQTVGPNSTSGLWPAGDAQEKKRTGEECGAASRVCRPTPVISWCQGCSLLIIRPSWILLP